ncbi:MAG: hypothetical protein ACJ75E_09925 [Actinomycetes bacterium]
MVDGAGQLTGWGGHLELDVQSGLTRHADQLLDLAKPRGGCAPEPLGVHPPPRLRLLGLLGSLRPLHRLGRQHPPAAHRLAQRRRHHGRADPEQHPSGGVERLQVADQQPRDRKEGNAGRDDL